MKLSHMIGSCGAAALAATMFCAEAAPQSSTTGEKAPAAKVNAKKDSSQAQSKAENVTQIRIVEGGLVGRDNMNDAPPENLKNRKPSAAIFSADAIAQKAAAAVPANEIAQPTNTLAKIKSLTVEGIVIPPSAAKVKTLEEAVRNILGQAGKQVGTVSSNGIDKLTGKYQQLGDGKSYEIEWRKALQILLSPVDYNFTEDGELVLFGRTAEVDVKHRQLVEQNLAANHTPILFTTNEAEGGMELRSAIRDVAIKAKVTITTDYMEPSDLYVPTQTTAAEGKMTADDINKAKTKTAVQQSAVKRTTFDTNGQKVEWRIVLREILNPLDYDFAEVGGVVRIAKRAKLAQWEKDKVAAKPLTAKVIRLYHADPDAVVEKLKGVKDLLRHPNASLLATRKKDDNTATVKNLNARIQTSSGQQSGMSDTTSQIFDKLMRPRTVPAIIAYDVEENIANIEAKIKLFDIKEKQILIEAIIFQLDSNNGENGDRDGILWSGFEDVTAMYGSFGNVGDLATTFPTLVDAVEKTSTAIKSVPAILTGTDSTTGESYEYVGSKLQESTTSRTVNKGRGMFDMRNGRRVWMKSGYLDFKAQIQMIRERSNSKLLASPMIVVGDHSEAAIQVSDVDPVPQIDASALSSGDNLQENMNIQWNMVRSGILMWVSPEITERSGSVRLTVHPQVVSKGARVDLKELGGKFAEYPVYNYELKMHEMDTRATVPSGATLMFGGLIDNSEEEVESKVRWLGDIPLIGWLFRSKTKTMVQKNLIIMIRPTIIEDTEPTGFETNALKEAKSVMVNSGRNLKSTPLGGPNKTFKETGKKVKDFVDERVIAPFKPDPKKAEAKEAEGKKAEGKKAEGKKTEGKKAEAKKIEAKKAETKKVGGR